MEKINEIFWEEGYECMSIRFCEEILLKLSWDSFWNVVLNRVVQVGPKHFPAFGNHKLGSKLA